MRTEVGMILAEDVDLVNILQKQPHQPDLLKGETWTEHLFDRTERPTTPFFDADMVKRHRNLFETC